MAGRKRRSRNLSWFCKSLAHQLTLHGFYLQAASTVQKFTQLEDDGNQEDLRSHFQRTFPVLRVQSEPSADTGILRHAWCRFMASYTLFWLPTVDCGMRNLFNNYKKTFTKKSIEKTYVHAMHDTYVGLFTPAALTRTAESI